MPAPDASEEAKRILTARWPQHHQPYSLPRLKCANWRNATKRSRKQSAQSKEQAGIANRLRAAIGPAEGFTWDGGKVTWKPTRRAMGPASSHQGDTMQAVEAEFMPQALATIPQQQMGLEQTISQQQAMVRAAVEARYALAIRQPRDLDAVRLRLIKDCKRPRFARSRSLCQATRASRTQDWPVGRQRH